MAEGERARIKGVIYRRVALKSAHLERKALSGVLRFSNCTFLLNVSSERGFDECEVEFICSECFWAKISFRVNFRFETMTCTKIFFCKNIYEENLNSRVHIGNRLPSIRQTFKAGVMLPPLHPPLIGSKLKSLLVST